MEALAERSCFSYGQHETIRSGSYSTLDKGDDVLNYHLIHPPLLMALARAGHGSRILIADGNFPYATVRSPEAEVVLLNFRRGLLDVNEVLTTTLEATNYESATLMRPVDDAPVPAHEDYASILGPGFVFDKVDRSSFYEAVRAPDVGLIVATGDQRLFANIILTIGLSSNS